MSRHKSFLRTLVATYAQGPGQVPPPPLFCTWEKVPFFGNESALFSWNGSTVLAKLKCPFWSVPLHFQGASAASAYTESIKHAPSILKFCSAK